MAGRTWRQRKKGDWLRLLCSGDHDAFAEFIDKYKETVFMCCRRLGLNEDETEDVASETFLAVYRGLGRYSGKAELSTWLWSIAYRQAINHLRKNRRHLQLEAEADGEIAGSMHTDPATAVLHEETEGIVWKAVEGLPRLWAMAVILFYKEQKSIADIAKVMQIRHNTVKTYLFRGRERLKETLAPAFGENINVDK